MKKKAVMALVGLIFLLSCHEDEALMVSLGDNYLNNQTTVALVDSISVVMSTVKIDSIATSTSDYLLCGGYTDPNFGKISVTAYAQTGMPSAEIDDEEIFDSIVVRLKYSGLAYGDTLLPQTIRVHRVTEEIEPNDEYDDLPYLFNTTSLKYASTPLGEKTFVPKPNFHDTLQIRLSDEVGLEFLELLRDDNDELDDVTEFLEYFKGIALVPGEENNSVLSFDADTSIQVKLYTHVIEETKIENVYKFTLGDSYNHYNKITNDVTGTGLELVTSQKEAIGSGALNKRAFVQAGTGYTTRIDFPNINMIFEEYRKNILYKAELVLKPLPGSFLKDQLPEAPVLYTTDKRNNVLTALTDDDGNTLTGTLYYDDYYNENTRYLFDITDYLYDELSDGYVEEEAGLLVMFSESDYCSTLNGVVFDARSGNSYRPRLNLYYVFYE